jgi:hypothetical protein
VFRVHNLFLYCLRSARTCKDRIAFSTGAYQCNHLIFYQAYGYIAQIGRSEPIGVLIF